ncbi:polysaccharide deacetylase family protein [[Pseudomonas] carboxydohydrogena]|uniref:Chitooligosaccharide deacetylase n=1 Tax=Afipia carboxydohydrogena TaxID=290 RepID=A0ABY8BSD1_AFICR|nr:polysaccharide deacetylase family protein [[Pseudomonas] carboxydohydrogena]WEF52888.1 polysaccharide deacetylase family protein [[Pseudomonas] carboxydohydrogena]
MRSLVLRSAATLLVLSATPFARAAECPGHPDALGTSRTLVVDPTEHPRIGTMQYPETLPLADHEVVLTFDDGPLPRHTKPILDILAAQCVKATFFVVGQMVNAYPQELRAVRDAGHTIGTHTQHHPLRMNRMSIEENKAEIDEGIASAAAALGDPAQVAPFLRIPGLLRSTEVEDYLTSKGIQTWSADFPADDWHRISPARVTQLAISRLEAKGRGVLLLHDIQARTEKALPGILRELKARGYRIVHVVPATKDLPKTPTAPWQWRLHPVEPVLSAADGMRFRFAPQPRRAADKTAAMAAVPAVVQTSRKGDISALWWNVYAGAQDATAALLSSSSAAFQFGKDMSKLPHSRAASALPTE